MSSQQPSSPPDPDVINATPPLVLALAERVRKRSTLTAEGMGFKSLSPEVSPGNSDNEDEKHLGKKRTRHEPDIIRFPSLRATAAAAAAPRFHHHTSKSFKDQVHGQLELPALCVAIMDTPQFQRLRNLKQLGAAYLVFPGASHNRFEHCIGVSYLAGTWARHLRDIQPELNISPIDILAVECAGLVHDLGHGPFSHTFDGFFVHKNRPDRPDFSHEAMSVELFRELIRDNEIDVTQFGLTHVDLLFIEEVILGTKLQGGISHRRGRPQALWFLYDIVNNVHDGLDCDKLDYYERDSANTGVKNACDWKRLVMESRVIARVPTLDGRLLLSRIVFPDKLLTDVLAAYQTRFRLHHQVYHHKVVRAIDLMIVDALTMADRAGVFSFRGRNKKDHTLAESINDPVAFCLAQDDVLQQIRRSLHPEAAGARELVRRIDRRELYKSIGEVSISRRVDHDRSHEVLISMTSQHHHRRRHDQQDDGEEEDEQQGTMGVAAATTSHGEAAAQSYSQVERKLDLSSLFELPEHEIATMIVSTNVAQEFRLAFDEVLVEKLVIHHGLGAENPLNRVYFFSKANPRRARLLHMSKYENLCPRTFAKEAIRVFCTSADNGEHHNRSAVVHDSFLELINGYDGNNVNHAAQMHPLHLGNTATPSMDPTPPLSAPPPPVAPPPIVSAHSSAGSAFGTSSSNHPHRMIPLLPRAFLSMNDGGG